MSDIHRFYKCGCHPDAEEFCPIGDFLVWTGRDAMTVWSGLESGPGPNPEREEDLLNLDRYSHYLMSHHLNEQVRSGDFQDVDFDAPEMQPPDDGYDEDPREVGYSS